MSELSRVLDANLYMTLATADADGVPWATPVYYSASQEREFYWVSSPNARHSRNIAVRPEIGIAIFDSQVQVGRAEAVYVSALASQVPDADLDAAAEIFNSRRPDLEPFTRPELTGDSIFRLYRATAVEHSVLVRGNASNTGVDSRAVVELGPAEPGGGMR
jgi:nitroimidazol reductase NimA-like FMN-containing flavoprotein (pyridoxamine 5'-phosphate oxidase superfamily)